MKQLLEKLNKTNPWINKSIVFLTKHGSHAYGTNTPESDEDFKGICIPPKEYYLSPSKHFEQQELKEPDTVIFEIKKFFNLAIQSNPNTLEVLFTEPQDHIYTTPIGEKILENKQKFLSKKIKFSLSGYAISQLKRIELHRKYPLNPPKSYPTRKELGLPEKTLIPQDQLLAVQAMIDKELEKYNFDFLDGLTEPQKIELKDIVSKITAELKITSEDKWLSAARKIGIDDNFIYLMQKEKEYTTKKKEFDQYENWKKTRNPKRAELEAKFGFDSKHAYHLVRLIRMCKECLTTGQLIVKRPDAEELLEIRNGKWNYEQLIQYAKEQEKIIDELYHSTKILPHSPDVNYLDNLCIELIERTM